MSGILGIERVYDDEIVPRTFVFSLGAQLAIVGQKIYWGVGSAPANTETFIKSLAGSAVAPSNSASFTVNASGVNKIYFAAPARYGFAAFVSGGFAGGFIQRSNAVPLTNVDGFSENYSLYESVSAGLGVTLVGVS